MTRLEAIEKAAHALLNDIGGMQSSRHTSDSFGPFSEWEIDCDEEGVKIEWPNLAISAAALAKALESLA